MRANSPAVGPVTEAAARLVRLALEGKADPVLLRGLLLATAERLEAQLLRHAPLIQPADDPPRSGERLREAGIRRTVGALVATIKPLPSAAESRPCSALAPGVDRAGTPPQLERKRS